MPIEDGSFFFVCPINDKKKFSAYCSHNSFTDCFDVIKQKKKTDSKKKFEKVKKN